MALIAFALIGAIRAPSVEVMIPKAAGLTLGLLTYRCVVRTAITEERFWAAVWLYLLAGCTAVVAGLLVSPQWQRKFAILHSITPAIPRLLPGLPGAKEGVNTNALGATTLFFLPLLIAFVVFGFSRTGLNYPAPLDNRRARIGLAFLYVAMVLVLLAILVLTESRTAWFAVSVAPVVMAAVRWRWVTWTSGFVAVATVVGIAAIGPSRALDLVEPHLPGNRTYNLDIKVPRSVIWMIAVNEISRHPIAGLGLGGFRVIAPQRAGVGRTRESSFVHAHNTFLQVAADMGLPGLVAYISLLFLQGAIALACAKRGLAAAAALGLFATSAAVHAFGMLDAIALGAKIGIFFWWGLGLCGALYNLNRPHAVTPALSFAPSASDARGS